MVANHCLDKIINNESLTVDETLRLFQVMSLGGATPAMISAVLISLKMKGYSEDELKGLLSFLNTKKVKILTDQKIFGFHVDPRVGIECFFTALVMASIGHATYIKFPKTSETNIYTSLGINLRQTDDAIGYQISKNKIAASYAKGSSFLRNIREVKNELNFYSILDDGAPFIFNTGVYGSYVRINHKINAELFAKVACSGFQEKIAIHNKERLTIFQNGQLNAANFKFAPYENLPINELAALLRTNLSSCPDDENNLYIKDFCSIILVMSQVCGNKEEALEIIRNAQQNKSLLNIFEEMIKESNNYSQEVIIDEE